MQIQGRASHLRNTPRKVNLVVASIVGLNVDKALEKLQFTLRRASDPVSKVLKQTIANAVNNYKLNRQDLVIKEAFATKGRVLERGWMGSRSRYKPYERVHSHLTIKLEAKTAKTKEIAVKAKTK